MVTEKESALKFIAMTWMMESWISCVQFLWIWWSGQFVGVT